MTTQTRAKLTYEDYLNAPETNLRYEIIDGEMVMAPSPTANHQDVLGNLQFALRAFIALHNLGKVWFAPLDVIVSHAPLRTRQPDLMFIRKERLGIVEQVVEGPPDLVAEAFSPSHSRAEMAERLADYYNLGALECWLVSQEARTIEILARGETDWRRLALVGLGDVALSEVLAGLQLKVDEVFQ